jgi:DedD protein
MSTRRGGLGLAQRLGLGVAMILVLSLTFALGVLVGRHWARQQPLQAVPKAEEAPGGVAAAPGSDPTAAAASPDRPRPEKEKLTFYQTLTAPVGPAGESSSPAERKPVASSAMAARPQGPATAPGGTATRSQAPPTGGAPTSASAGVSRPADEGGPAGRWAVQVGAFKSRDQAESVQRRLSGSGYAVSITSVTASDGLRYRVRLGGYGSRSEAEQVAARVRSGGGLSTFVTPL